jgi:glycosyltransferase 2 family protein
MVGLKIGVTLIAIVAIVKQVDLAAVADTLTLFPISSIPFILGFLTVGLAASALKWQVILKGLGRPVAFASLVRLAWVGLFFNTFLPGRTGGDIVRAWSLAASDSNRLRSFASVAVDRAANLFALVLLGSVATLIDPRIPEELVVFVRTLALVSIIGLFGFLALRRKAMQYLPQKVQELLRTLDTGRWCSRRIAAVVTLAVVFQTVVVLINIVAARGLQIPVTSTALFVVVPLTAIVTAIPISINGFGIREAAYATILSYVGAGPEVAVALSLTVTTAMIAWSLGGGACFVFSTVAPRKTELVGESRAV